LKDPDNLEAAPPGVANLQIMAMVPASFRAWGTSEAAFLDGSYRREPGYIEAKERFADSIINEVDRVIKGISAQIVYKEISSPITVRRYIGSSDGTSYGLALTPEQFLSNRPGAKTYVRGLYLCGASTRNGHGIYASLMSGVEAYGAIFGRAARAKILDKSRQYAMASSR
jgi:phytoene dehydrogenase-like protein